MSFEDRAWRIWRNAHGFHQRFEGRLHSDGCTMEAHWEKSTDGKAWERDFDLKYVKRV
jgi:hypothetical protein